LGKDRLGAIFRSSLSIIHRRKGSPKIGIAHIGGLGSGFEDSDSEKANLPDLGPVFLETKAVKLSSDWSGLRGDRPAGFCHERSDRRRDPEKVDFPEPFLA
jgi:hypothetical protein